MTTAIQQFDPGKAKPIWLKTGTSLAVIAAVIGVSKVAVINWLNGVNVPSYENMQRLAQALQVELDEICS